MLHCPRNFSRISVGILFLLFFHCAYLISQPHNYRVERVLLTGDLSEVTLHYIMQDSDGFMWLATDLGMYRYDGSRFKAYCHNPLDPNSISGNGVNHVIEDSAGIMWISTLNGLNRFDRKTETIQRFNQGYGVDLGPDTRNIFDFTFDDNQGSIWISTWNGMLSKFDKASQTFTNYPLNPTDSAIGGQKRIFRLCQDSEGFIWVQYGDDGLCRFDPKTEEFEHLHNVPCDLKALLEDSSGRFWVTSYCGAYLLDRVNMTFERVLNDPEDPNRLNDPMVRAIMEDKSGYLWIKTFDGIYKYNQELELKYYWKFRQDRMIVQDFLVEDRDGTIWFLNNDGINKIVKQHNYFRTYIPDQPYSDDANSICVENNDVVWFGDLGGVVFRLDRRIDKFTRYYIGEPGIDRNFYRINEIYKDKSGSLWIGTGLAGLYRINQAGDQIGFKRYIPDSGDPKQLLGYAIKDIFEDSRERLWVGLNNGKLSFLDKDRKKLIYLVNNPESQDTLPVQSFVRHESNPDTLWTSGQGVHKIVLPLIRVTDTTMMPTDVIGVLPVVHNQQYIVYSTIQFSYRTSEGALLIAPWHQGFFKFIEDQMPDNSLLENGTNFYTTASGLPHNQVQSIIEDDSGNLWIGTSNGLSRFDKQAHSFANFYRKDGLSHNKFRGKSAAKSGDGELFFGTENGMISFYPDSIRIKENPPDIIITEFKLENQEIRPGENSILSHAIQYTEEISLKHHQNTISFEFASLNYIQSIHNSYKYRMDGVDEDWIFSGSRNYTNYVHMKPGRYTFRVSGSNYEGVWNEKEASINITISPPFWRSIWAYLGYSLMLITLIRLYRGFLIRREKVRSELKFKALEVDRMQEVDQMKSRFFANISHEFRTPLTLILGPINDLLKNSHRLGEVDLNLLGSMKRNAGRLHQLINQLLDLSKLETGSLKLQVSEGNFTEFVKVIIRSFLSLAESKNIRLAHELADPPDATFFDKDNLQKILTNLISNAIKFTSRDGVVVITLHFEYDIDTGLGYYTVIKVIDTGPGIEEEVQERIYNRFYQVENSDNQDHVGSGIGLSLVKELVDLYRGTINLRSEIGKGSTFAVRLPVSREFFREDELTVVSSSSEKILMEKSEGFTEYFKAEVEQESASNNNSGGPVILVVEDNRDLREYISHNLNHSFQVVEAENGSEGLNEAIEKIPDLVISDLMMPEMDGISLCAQLKSDQRTSHIPFIMLTARADRESKLESLESGADDYLIKPFDADELRIRVENLIAQRRKLRERYRKAFLADPKGDELHDHHDVFLSRVMGCMQKCLSESDFGVDQLGKEVGLSRTQLYRKIRALTDQTPSELLRNARLKTAARMFHEGEKNVASVMYAVGINSSASFAQYFRELYDLNPSDYIKQISLRVK